MVDINWWLAVIKRIRNDKFEKKLLALNQKHPIISQIPNVITLLNLLSGSLAVIMLLSGDMLTATLLIALAAIFDFLDGFTARLLNVKSLIGKELDSLADVISFGLVPALFLYITIGKNPAFIEFDGFRWIPYTALLIAAFSAYRLAVFNLDERQLESFRGLPTPANAIFIISLSLVAGSPPMFDAGFISTAASSFWLQLLIIPLSCWLLVSGIPMFSLKFGNGFGFRNNQIRYLFLLLSVLLILIFKVGGIPLVILAYIATSLFAGLKNV